MVVIYPKVMMGFPFFFGDVREDAFGLGCEFFWESLIMTQYSVQIQSVFPKSVFSN